MMRCLEEDTRWSSYVVYIIAIRVTKTLTSFWLIQPFLNTNTGFGEVRNSLETLGSLGGPKFEIHASHLGMKHSGDMRT